MAFVALILTGWVCFNSWWNVQWIGVSIWQVRKHTEGLLIAIKFLKKTIKLFFFKFKKNDIAEYPTRDSRTRLRARVHGLLAEKSPADDTDHHYSGSPYSTYCTLKKVNEIRDFWSSLSRTLRNSNPLIVIIISHLQLINFLSVLGDAIYDLIWFSWGYDLGTWM